MADVDTLLYELEEAIRTEKVEGDFFPCIYMRTGLNIAATVIARKRIELLVAGMLNDETVCEEEGAADG